MPAGWAMAAAAVVGAGVSYATAEQAEDAAYAAQQASMSQDDKARALNVERYGEAQDLLDPFTRTERRSNTQMERELGLGAYKYGYVPGRDDISQMGERQTPEQLRREMAGLAPGGSAYLGEAEQIDQAQYMQDLSSGYSAFIDNPAYQSMIDQGVSSVESSAASQGMFRSGTTMDALRDVGQDVSSQYFTNYLGVLSDITGINESRRTANQNIDEQRFANMINLQEGRDVRSSNVEEQRYANYMNMLQAQANPSASTNLAALGVNQGITMGQSGAAAVAQQNQYAMGATAAQNAAYSDFAGGLMNLGGAYMGSQGSGGQTGGTIYGGAASPNAPNYGGYA